MEYSDKTLAEYYNCSDCGFETIKYPRDCCNFPKNEPVAFYKTESEYYSQSDNYSVYNQCKNCGRKNGTQLSKSKFDKNELNTFDYELEKRRKEIKKEIQNLTIEINDRIRNNKRDTFWDDYSEYLKSDEWKEKREIVLKRDNHICQSCLIQKAEEVHHTIGRFRKNEPLFTLISVCSKCHQIITEIDRGNHKRAEKIKYK